MDCAKTWQTKEATVEKIHMGICPISHEILVEETTELEIADCQMAPTMLKKLPRSIKRVIGDGAYDTEKCYKAAYSKGGHFAGSTEKRSYCKLWKEALDDI